MDLQQADTFLSKDELGDWAETFIIKVGSLFLPNKHIEFKQNSSNLMTNVRSYEEVMTVLQEQNAAELAAHKH